MSAIIGFSGDAVGSVALCFPMSTAVKTASMFAGTGLHLLESRATPVLLLPCDSALGRFSTEVTMVPAGSRPPARLERKGDEIHDLRCALEYRIDDRIDLDEIVKYGSIRFKRAEPLANPQPPSKP